MWKLVLALLYTALPPILLAQATAPTGKTTVTPVPDLFTFDNDAPGKMPAGWGGGPANTIAVDDSVAHSGKNSVRLQRDKGSGPVSPPSPSRFR